MGKISEILDVKGRVVHSIDSGSSVFDAIRKMVDEGVGSLVVMKGDTVCGIFTERDYLRRIALEGRTSRDTRVIKVTTERLVCVESSRDVDECMTIMTQERVRHLPVIEEGRLSGIVSIGDLVKHVAEERAVEIRYLTDYVSGKYPG